MFQKKNKQPQLNAVHTVQYTNKIVAYNLNWKKHDYSYKKHCVQQAEVNQEYHTEEYNRELITQQLPPTGQCKLQPLAPGETKSLLLCLFFLHGI